MDLQVKVVPAGGTSRRATAREMKPLLQKAHTPQVLPELKMEMPQRHYWKWPRADHERCLAKVDEAERRIAVELEALWSSRREELLPPLS